MQKRTWLISLGILAILLGILVLVIVWAGGSAARGSGNGDIVKINYTTTLEDGTVYATSVGGEPLWLILGEGKLLPSVEAAIVGMRIGESKTVNLPADKAYGPYRPELVAKYSKSELPKGVTPQVGQRLQAKGKDGKPYPAVITEVTEDSVTVDSNSPLAGKNLAIKIELLAAGENLASSDRANQAIVTRVLAALVMVLAAGLVYFYLRSMRGMQRGRRKPQPIRSGLARKSEGRARVKVLRGLHSGD